MLVQRRIVPQQLVPVQRIDREHDHVAFFERHILDRHLIRRITGEQGTCGVHPQSLAHMGVQFGHLGEIVKADGPVPAGVHHLGAQIGLYLGVHR